MKVETFECHETASEPIEISDEAKTIIESLELSGQAELLSVDEFGNNRRSPYREMTADETWVYKTLCPKSFEIEKYKASSIPFRVLQVAAHAKQVIPDCRLFVWDRVSAAIPDPVLVAETGRYAYSPDKRFILARWGHELEAFSTLIRQAAEMRRQELLSTAKKALLWIETASDAEIGPASMSTSI